jgi:hypothetical protein
MLQHQQLKKPKDKKLAKLVDQLLAAHRDHFWGPVADYLDMLDDVEWFMGYIKSVKVLTSNERCPGFGDKSKTKRFEELLDELLELPSARFLQNLTLGIQRFDGNNYAEAAKVIAKRKRPALRSLFVGDFHSEETELNWSDTGLMQPLYKALPNLEHLTLRSGGISTGKIELPNLRSFTVISGGLSTDSLKQIAAAKWPKLEKLTVQLGQELMGNPIKDLKPILTGKGLKNLTELGLTNGKYSDEIAAELPGAPILKQLKRLDLSMGVMSDVGAAHIAENADKFRHLEEIDLSENYISDALIKQLKRVCKNAIFKSDLRNWRRSVLPNGQKGSITAEDLQDPDYDDYGRYISAYE